MPFPLALAGGLLGGGRLGGLASALGISEQRLRTPAQNRAARVQQIAEAMQMARQGKRLGVMLLLQWSGQLPNHTVSDPDYKGGTPQGRMPSDGVTGALRALDTLRSEGTLIGTKLVKGKSSEDISGARQGVRSAAKEKAFAEAFLEDISAPSSGRSTTRRGAGERTYTRYDPATGRKVKVTQDDPRYDEWPNRKPSRRALAEFSGGETGGRAGRGRKAKRYDPMTGRAVQVYPDDPRYDDWPSRKPPRGSTPAAMRRTLETRIRNAGLRATGSLVGKFTTIASAAGISTGAAAAAVVAAGAVSFAVTTAAMKQLERARDPAVKRSQVALAYREARKKLAAKQGRALNATEQKLLAEWFKDTMRAKGFGAYLQGV